MGEVTKLYEKSIIAITKHPSWFENLSFDDEKLVELYDAGLVVPLQKRDKDGCRMVLKRGAPDPKKFTYLDHLRLILLVYFTFATEPETQVSGVIAIEDYKDLKLEQVAMYPMREFAEVLMRSEDSLPLYQKKIVALNVPSLAIGLAELAKSVYTKKMNVTIHSDDKALKDFDQSILPKEYGGEVAMKVMLDEYKETIKAQSKLVQLFLQQRVGLEKLKQKDSQFGSFRKLETE
jgi:CRAL/TRIO domain